MPTLPIHFNYDGSDGASDNYVYLFEIQALSALQTLVVSDAPLKMIQLVYQADPSAMNDDVFLDACRHSPNSDVIEFLKELVVEPSVYAPAKIAQIMVDLLENKRNFDADGFVALFTIFPEAAYYNELSGEVSGPFHAVFTDNEGYWGGHLHDDVLCDMIRHIPGDVEFIEIGSLDRIREAESKTECRSLLAAKLKELKNLKGLELPIELGDESDQILVEAICHSISSGPLETLRINSSGFEDNIYEESGGDSGGKDQQSGFFLPILDVIAASGLKHFSLPDCFHLVEGYRDRMIEILEWNTSLTGVTIGKVFDFGNTSWKHTKALNDKALIDDYTRMNAHGRGVMRDPNTTLRAIVDLLDKVTASCYRDIHFRDGSVMHRKHNKDLTTVRALNGLLREAPGKWSDQALDEDTNKNKKPSAKSPPNRKRKASHSLDQSICLD
ncbi:expressed unknown protein [Seminavis robusta]|uniref:Uncharacterized protein n=1 Tax=Seminavis robusta TaxID=568900 RepID=A0A9N8E435_9STRA|nr:expressed unknown protein [Seminavis robusta]|eukprot:Sro598_g173010.1 n/a (442) ;mRNA; f:23614-24939